MSTERKTEPDEQSGEAKQIMQLPQSSQGSSGSLAESDDTSEKLGNKRYRTRFTPHQLSTMESAFTAEKYPDTKARQELSEKLGLSEVQVQVWFQNKRAKARRKDKRKRQDDSPTVTIMPPSFWPKDIPFDTNITDFCQKTKRPRLSSPADSSSSGKTLSSQPPVSQVSHSEVQQITQPTGTSLKQPQVQHQAPHMKSQAPSKSAVTAFWLYENPPSEGQFSSSTSYQTQSQATEVFQSPTFLPFVEPGEDLFPLEPVMQFHSHGAAAYSQSQAGPSSSYAGGGGSVSSPMLPPISTYDDTPPLQPPVMPTTHLPPNPYNQPPPF